MLSPVAGKHRDGLPAGSPITEKEANAMKELRKRKANKKIAGVCGGIGEYFNVDPTLVRLGFVALSFMFGGGLVAYILAAIIMPDGE